ncbi:hypothetical protein SAMN04487865_11234, partial [Succinivibrio dextrinosolvens]
IHYPNVFIILKEFCNWLKIDLNQNSLKIIYSQIFQVAKKSGTSPVG